MSFLTRLFRSRPDPRDAMRPLWHRIVEIAREPHWYAKGGVADNVAGRFDMITAVLAAVLIRLEREPDSMNQSVWLTELFVQDMDGQLREAGIGDVVVGKHIGKHMAVLGGRLGAYRNALAAGGPELDAAIARNVTLTDGTSPKEVAGTLRDLSWQLEALDSRAVLAGEIVR